MLIEFLLYFVVGGGVFLGLYGLLYLLEYWALRKMKKEQSNELIVDLWNAEDLEDDKK